MEAPTTEVKEVKEQKETKESPEKKEIKEEAKLPEPRGKEEEPAQQIPLEPAEAETEEELGKKERFQELQTFLKKYNKRFPECVMVKDFAKVIWFRAQDPTDKEIQDYIKKYAKFDKDTDGLIDNKSVFEILEERAKAPDTPEELKKALLLLADSDGKLLKEELRYHLRSMGETLEEKEVKKLLEVGSDPNDDKSINIDQFVEAIFKAKVIKTK